MLFINNYFVNEMKIKHCPSCRCKKCLAININPKSVQTRESFNDLEDNDKEIYSIL